VVSVNLQIAQATHTPIPPYPTPTCSPTLTPTPTPPLRYRENYQLYEGKPCITDTADECRK